MHLSLLAAASREALAAASVARAKVFAEVQAKFAEKAFARERFRERYGFARPPVATKMGDKWMMAIGGSIYRQTKEGGYNFVNAIHDHALSFFGPELVAEQTAIPFERMHPAMQWLDMVVARDEKLRQAGAFVDNDPARQSGAGAAWSRLAYDLYTIADNGELSAGLRRRLTSGTDFQGARHELRVAAQCVVAGFDLTYEDERDSSKTHPEFIAKDRFSDLRVAVEAKSRHRHGVQGFKGGHPGIPGRKIDARRLILDAFKKETKLPLYVFIDLNLPARDDADWQRWMEELDQTIQDLHVEGYMADCPANALFFSNDPSHYVAARVKVFVASFMQPAAVFLMLPNAFERSSRVRG